MASRKYDYSNDMAQDNEPRDKNEYGEFLRRQRLEQRNDSLAKEFRDLKPEIGRAYNCLCNLVGKSDALSGTLSNLLDLLRTALPVRLTDEDRKALYDEVHSIADNAVSKIRKERERVEDDIRGNDNRVSLTPATFWCMVALLILLSVFFALVVFANIRLLHSDMLTGLVVMHAILMILTLAAVAYTLLRKKH